MPFRIREVLPVIDGKYRGNCMERTGGHKNYRKVHNWARTHMIMPDHCPKCKRKNVPLDLSNKNHEYQYIIEDWQYLCRGCHIEYDRKHHGLYAPRDIGNDGPWIGCEVVIGKVEDE